jgi:hypothetical protein
MFGSLVIAYPTPHTGGTLRFFKGEKSWSPDSATLLSEQQEPSNAYAVFFSDVEHEVMPVTASHRIMATYNLHLVVDKRKDGDSSSSSDDAFTSTQIKDDVTSLVHALPPPPFLSKGGLMGFGLQYQYTVRNHTFHTFDGVFTRLKGVDAAVLRAGCRQLGLRTEGKALGWSDSTEFQWLLDQIPQPPKDCDEFSIDAAPVNSILVCGSGNTGGQGMDNHFVWDTMVNANARAGTQTFRTYGNEVRVPLFLMGKCQAHTDISHWRASSTPTSVLWTT